MAERPRFPLDFPGLAAAARLDAATGLFWEAAPAGAEATWEVARASALDGWRLPSALELMVFLAALPTAPEFPQPRAGDVFWSSSESPFASTTSVRAVAFEPPRQPAVLHLEKSAAARWWRVRADR